LENLIDNKLHSIIEKATITDVSDYHPVHIDFILEDDWLNLQDYPTIIINCFRADDMGKQIQGVTKRYLATIYLFIATSTYAEAREQRSIIKRRIETALRKSQRLDNLADNDISESAYNMDLETITFWSEGFTNRYISVVRFDLGIDTDRKGPFI
jgi:hypothetical protein